jgi:hypothetical protein
VRRRGEVDRRGESGGEELAEESGRPRSAEVAMRVWKRRVVVEIKEGEKRKEKK